jgi:hypothetical protein
LRLVRKPTLALLFSTALTAGACATARTAPSQRVERFFVESAALDDACVRRSVEPLFACHRLVPGRGVVVATRKYSIGENVDSGVFEKLTLDLGGVREAGESIAIPNATASAHFIAGSGAFPGDSGCVGGAKTGTVEVVRRSADSMTIRVDLEFDLRSPAGWDDCTSKRVSEEFTAFRQEVDSLTPWQGRVESETSVFDEANPVGEFTALGAIPVNSESPDEQAELQPCLGIRFVLNESFAELQTLGWRRGGGSRRLVRGDLVDLRCKVGFITGNNLASSIDLDLLDETDTRGYFVIDLSDGSIRRGLTEEEALRAVERRGATEPLP